MRKEGGGMGDVFALVAHGSAEIVTDGETRLREDGGRAKRFLIRPKALRRSETPKKQVLRTHAHTRIGATGGSEM